MSQTHEESQRRSTSSAPPSTPRWVKVFGIVMIVLVILFVILHLSGNGFGGLHSHTMPSSLMQQAGLHL